MKRAKITIVGAGKVGSLCAHLAAARELGDIVLIDTAEGLSEGTALDIGQAGPTEGFDARVSGASDFRAAANSDVVVIAAGVPRKPGASRDQMLDVNARVVARTTAQAVEQSPEAIVIVVSNPVDAMAHTARLVSGLPAGRVVGQAGALDAARFRALVAAEVGCGVEDVQALVLGGHGDDMVPLPRYASVGGIPVTQLIGPGKLDEIIARTRNGGAEIMNLLGSGHACHAPAAATVTMLEAVVRHKRRVLACSAYCDKEYDVGGCFIGVPCVLGGYGVERIIEVELDAHERKQLDASVSHVKELCAAAAERIPSGRRPGRGR